MLHSLIPDVIVIALLAGIESLLSAVVADGMTGGRHKSNCELVAEGIGNIGSVFFGGIPATGAIARTATNIKTGAKTPVAGIIHALTLFLVIFAFAPLVSKIPLCALSAVLVMVAWNMSELAHFRHLMKAPPGDVAVLLTTFLLTVFVDLTVAVEVGMVLAAFLFMKRMSDASSVISTSKLFFGVADSLKDVLHNLEYPPKVFILRMRKVPVLDATGMHALSEFHAKCKKEGTTLLLSGVQGQPKKNIEEFGIEELIGSENIFPHIDVALIRARELVKSG
jgi:SulP family sulfate permease